MVEHQYTEDISIKLTIYQFVDDPNSLDPEPQPLTFTCNGMEQKINILFLIINVLICI